MNLFKKILVGSLIVYPERFNKGEYRQMLQAQIANKEFCAKLAHVTKSGHRSHFEEEESSPGFKRLTGLFSVCVMRIAQYVCCRLLTDIANMFINSVRLPIS